MAIYRQIATASNDWMTKEGGSLTYTGTGQWFGNAGSGNFEWNAFRFLNIDIPQGATIVSATMEIICLNHLGTTPDQTIYGEKIINSPSGGRRIDTLARTTSSVAWANPLISVAGQKYTTPDLSSIIQEIVNQPEWQNNNALSLIFDGGAGIAYPNFGSFYSFDTNPARAAILTIHISTPGLAEKGKIKQKDFLVKVYDNNGSYITTWASDIVNTPNFVWKMNGGMGELVVDLKRPLKDFGESEDVAFGNIVKLYIQDGDQERGLKIWEGMINRYEPTSNSEGEELISVVATTRLLEMERRLIKTGSDTTVAYASKDPSHILKSLISMPAAGGILAEGIINDTSTTATYTFTANSIREGFDIVRKLSPQYWYWWLDADNKVNFKIANFEEIDHRLYIGKAVSNIRMAKSTENLCNRVYFMGGGTPNLYKMYERTSSQAEFGLREAFLKDERVTVDATAQLIATSYLDNFDHPISEIECEVVDSNIDPIDGYDIERFRPGDIVRILHPDMEKRNTLWDVAYWDVDYWDFDIRYALGQPHQIIEIQYEFNRCILRLAAKLEDFNKRMEEINRNLDETAKQGLPSAPT